MLRQTSGAGEGSGRAEGQQPFHDEEQATQYPHYDAVCGGDRTECVLVHYASTHTTHGAGLVISAARMPPTL
eukprot:9378-Eustigmatos_ZCMA.PRE.1